MGNCIFFFNTKETLDKNSSDLKSPNKQSQQCKVFIPPITSGKVIKVYDGDTITIATKVPGLRNSEVYKFSIRLNGIDSPELKSNNDDEKEIAKIAQTTLYDKIFDKVVTLKNVKLEKYGRLLCDVYLKELHLNNWLLDQRLAVPYDGGTKHKPESWCKFYYNN